MTASLGSYLLLVGLGICVAWASSCVWIGVCYLSSKIKLNSFYMFGLILYFILSFIFNCNFVIAICYCSTILVKLLVKFCFSNPAATNMYLLFSSGVVNFDEGRRGRQKSLFCCFLFFLAFSQFNFSCKFELIAFHFSISNVSSLLHHYL